MSASNENKSSCSEQVGLLLLKVKIKIDFYAFLNVHVCCSKLYCKKYIALSATFAERAKIYVFSSS